MGLLQGCAYLVECNGLDGCLCRIIAQRIQFFWPVVLLDSLFCVPAQALDGGSYMPNRQAGQSV